jgi:hypothetical protein
VRHRWALGAGDVLEERGLGLVVGVADGLVAGVGGGLVAGMVVGLGVGVPGVLEAGVVAGPEEAPGLGDALATLLDTAVR